MITRNEIGQVREKAKQIRALVIGDSMLDQYIYGVVDRISPEAPVPVVSFKRTEIKAGGAANVALNLAAWGCETTLVSLTGQDPNSLVLAELLEKEKIRHHLFKSPGRPTTIKTRVVATSHHLLRIDEESQEYLSGDEEVSVLHHILSFIRNERPDLIILEDYNKGFLTEKIIAAVIGIGTDMSVFMAVDPKEKNFFHFKGVNLFKPNLREAANASHRRLNISDLGALCEEWREQMNIGTMAVTLGSQGIFLQNTGNETLVSPDKAIDVVDVCGAGDAVICAIALGMLSGLELNKIGALANLTGAYVCSHSGVVTVDAEVIHEWI